MDIPKKVYEHVTNLIHKHNYDRQLSEHLQRQGPPWDDCVLKTEKGETMRMIDVDINAGQLADSFTAKNVFHLKQYLTDHCLSKQNINSNQAD